MEGPTQEGKPQWEQQVLEPSPIARSISNKDKGKSLEKMPNLKKTLTYCNNTFQNKDYLHML
jgi:hypothetical protein